MTKATGIRRWNLAFAVLALCCGNARAQGAQSVSRTNAKAQPTSAKAQPKTDGDNSGADAAAYAKLNSGQVDDAAAAFQAVLATQPKDAGALAGMGQVRMLQGNYLGAVSFLEQAKQASPNDASIAAALDGARFEFLMGEGHDAQTAKDAADAEKRYRDALELRPDARQAVDALVSVLVAENKLSDAQDTLSTAVAQSAAATGRLPAELELELAQLDLANSQPQLAYPLFLQVLQESPARVDAWSGLISALHLMGHDADAVAQEKVVPAEARAQLEATPGFQEMMAAMASTPQPAALGEPAFAPFVPSAAPAASAVVTQAAPAPVASATATVPAMQNTQRVPPRIQSGSAFAKTNAAKPATAQSGPKSTAATLPTPKPPTAVAQTAGRGHAMSSAGSGAPLVTQPASRPASHGEEIPDTGEQQYPQPKARPRAAASTSPAQQ